MYTGRPPTALTANLELGKGLGSLHDLLLDTEDVETHGLGQRPAQITVSTHVSHSTTQRKEVTIPALTDSHNITNLDTNEARRHVSSQVLVTLLVTVVFGDVVEVFTTDDDGPLHLSDGHNDTGQDTTTDGDLVGGEGALFVDVVTFDGFTGSLEAETNVLVPPLDGPLLARELGVLEDTDLGLEGLLGLFWGGERNGSESDPIGRLIMLFLPPLRKP